MPIPITASHFTKHIFFSEIAYRRGKEKEQLVYLYKKKCVQVLPGVISTHYTAIIMKSSGLLERRLMNSHGK